MKKLNQIGLDAKQSKKLADKLNELLADYAVFYQNVRGYHWNVRGEKFFELHIKFEELYNDLFVKIDDIAERILTLGYQPEYRYSKYAKISAIKESKQTEDGIKDVKEIVAAFQLLIQKQRDILNIADDLGDEGTNALMSDYIREQEKLVWMYSAFLG
jgi:starvation-inducible DNA-binding protein